MMFNEAVVSIHQTDDDVTVTTDKGRMITGTKHSEMMMMTMMMTMVMMIMPMMMAMMMVVMIIVRMITMRVMLMDNDDVDVDDECR